MSASTLAEDILRIGRDAGLDAVGICDAARFADTRSVLQERRDEGLSAGMAFTYRNPARSTDPSRAVPGARALVVGAHSYYRRTPEPDPRPGPIEESGHTGTPMARVARYAWSDHYKTLRDGLGVVAARLREDGWKALVLADDNAMVDRAAAVRAGLGWYGKNANVLLPGRGSWFVLGSVVTDAPIAPGEPPVPVEDGCGACRQCMVDCPTGALVAPGRLDARRCLAWLLQAPGVFPLEYRAALGDRLYGCDACQERCPVNRRMERTLGAEGAEPADSGAVTALAALEVLDADDQELEAMVGRWYIPGREMRYVRRNALVVLGNTGSPDHPATVAALARAASDADPLIRGHAAWAAGRIGLPAVVARAAMDPDPYVRREAATSGEAATSSEASTTGDGPAWDRGPAPGRRPGLRGAQPGEQR